TAPAVAPAASPAPIPAAPAPIPAAPGVEPAPRAQSGNGNAALEHVKVFGRPGEPGSYRVVFDRRGAAVWEVRLLSDYVSPEARHEKEHEWSDYYPIATTIQPRHPSLLLYEDGPAPRFTEVK